MLNVSWWEFIGTIVAILSLFGNLIQYFNRRRENKPLRHVLVGLLNDVKTKSVLCYTEQNLLFNPKNPHTQIDTLRWEFGGFLFSIIQALQGFQEHIVGSLKALNVKENEIVKAIDFGLSNQEKEAKDLWWKDYKSRLHPPDQSNPNMEPKT
jgi:hypothetical protein